MKPPEPLDPRVSRARLAEEHHVDPNDSRLDEMARRMSGVTGPHWRQQKDFVRFLSNPVLRSLASGLGVDIDGLLTQQRDVRESTVATLQAAIWFGPFGWTVSGHQLKSSDYIEAVRLWEKTSDETVIDEHLTRAWADPVWLRRSFGPLKTLAGRHAATLDMLLERNKLLHKALDLHDRGEYEASTMIVLAQIDGLTLDFTDGKHGFFYRGKDYFFEDDATLAGMPDFLKTVRKAVNRDDHRTPLSTAFRRHPIVHGRYLAFGTETNSTKAFALLSGVLEWLKPKAAVVTEERQAEHEARFTGSDARDEGGRRRDRRGFAETRESLRWLSIREANEYRAHGRYNGDLHGMFPREGIGRMKRRDGTTLTVAPDGQSYWAWSQSDTDVCFGVAASIGAVTSSYYADVGPPRAPGDDERWVDELVDGLPDWSGDWAPADADRLGGWCETRVLRG